MQIEHPRPAVLRVTLHAYEMAALIAAGRWVAEGAEGELNPGIREQLQAVVADYDKALQNAVETSASDEG
jgi:hypothetical protein